MQMKKRIDIVRKLQISAEFVVQLSMSQFDHTSEYSSDTAGFLHLISWKNLNFDRDNVI